MGEAPVGISSASRLAISCLLKKQDGQTEDVRERTEREVDGVDEPGQCRVRWCWWWRRWSGVTDVRGMVQA